MAILRTLPSLVGIKLAIACWLATQCKAQESVSQQAIAAALDSARPALLAHLRLATAKPERAGELALLVLAGLHDGLPPGHPVLGAALQALAKARPTDTYSLSLRLMVWAEVAEFPQREKLAAADLRQLLRHRGRSGCFSYGEHPQGWDLSNTQYAALGLRAALALQLPVERGVWTAMARKLLAEQDSYGGFGYGERSKRRDNAYSSMTAAGIAVLAICRDALPNNDPVQRQLGLGIERGWQWFGRNPRDIGNPSAMWGFYFHYGLERAAILCDKEEIHGIDWYRRGAGMLIAQQLAEGGWGDSRSSSVTMAAQRKSAGLLPGHGDQVSTAFAILFLRRGFRKEIAAPVTPRIVLLANIGPHSRAADVDACAADLVRRGTAALPDVLWALRSEVVTQRRAAAKALQELAGETFGYDPELGHDDNRAACRRAELWHLRQR